MRCANCGGLNPVEAEWCGQCFEKFGAAPGSPPVAGGTPARVVRGPAGAPDDADVHGGRGPFVVTAEEILWQCAICGQSHPLHADRCSVCGAAFADVLRSEPERPQRDPNTAALLSLFLPGAGHGYVGLWGQAVARGVLSAFSVMAFLVTASSGGNSMPIAMVFGAVAFGVWAAAAHDAYREATGDGDQVLLTGKRVLYLVLGLLALLFGSMTSTFLDARAYR